MERINQTAEKRVLRGYKNLIYDTLLKFFKMVSNKLNFFLKGFLTDKSITPFVADVRDNIVRDFLIGVILKDVFRKAKTIDVGLAAKLKLEQAGLKPSESKVYSKTVGRSSHPEVVCKKGFLKNIAKFTGKQLCQSDLA